MPPLELEIADVRFYRGCAAALSEPTALVEVTVRGAAAGGAADRVRAGLAALSPEEPLHGVAESDWPAAFLVERSAGLAEWAVATAIALQRWAHDPVWRGRVVADEPHRWSLAIPWQRRDIVDGALRLALELVGQWARPTPDPAALQRLVGMFRDGLADVRRDGLAPSTMRFIQAAVERGIPFDIAPQFVQFGWGAAAERMDAGLTGRTSFLSARTARSKVATGRTLTDAGLPVASGAVVGDVDRAAKVAEQLGWPVAVRPANLGQGLAPGVRDPLTLRRAFDEASRLNPGNVVVERHVEGSDHRMLVAHERVLAAVRLGPGDTAEDVTARVHPDNRLLAQRAARIIGLDIAAVDVRSPDIAESWREVDSAVSGVSAQPGLRPFWLADPDRDINGEIIDILFAGRSGRIPTAAVTGADGAGATAMHLSRIWAATGIRTGVCTTSGVRIGDEILSTADLSGYPGARLLLADPDVQAAVLEVPRDAGHPCDRYDAVALLDVRDTDADLVRRAREAVVVNADDPSCLSVLASATAARRILVAADPATVAAHRAGGGEAVVLGERDGRTWIVAATGETETSLMPSAGDAETMFAAALAWAQGIL